MPFRYSGSKKRLIKYLPGPPLGTKEIVEPFAGSAAYSLHYRPPTISLAENNEDVRRLWTWLSTEATAEGLAALEKKHPSEKIDVRSLDLPKAQETLLRLTISGVYVGQLSSWTLYPQHKCNFSVISDMLPYLQAAVRQPVLPDFKQTTQYDGKRVLYFVDPPYLGTKGNYQDKTNKKDMTKSLSAAEVESFVSQLKAPVLLTYGDGAQETFPSFKWELATKRKVPIIRTGGTKERTEWFTKLNW